MSCICWFCHLPGSYLLKCSGCKKARYCGETCYREDWERHREWCRKKGEKREQRREKRGKNEVEDQMESEEKDEVD